jgi:3'-phosphoadenosine 5'-phosphosulfate sulfotransferase (PAPS reductase)/FAD synthetase
MVLDRATGEGAWTFAATPEEANETLEAWAQARLDRDAREPNPYEPKWKPGQGKLRRQRAKEISERGDVAEAQAKIEKLRDRGALFVVSHSGGKDSQAMALKVHQLVPPEQIVWIHAPLKGVEWAGIIEQIRRYKPEGVPLLFADAVDKYGEQKYLLDFIIHRGMWPSKGIRVCTSDFKIGPIKRDAGRYADAHGFTIIVDAQGLRAQESPDRSNRPTLKTYKKIHGVKRRATGQALEYYEWLPIKWDTADEVFGAIEDAGQVPMWTYLEGMERASCALCILASIPDLRRAAELAPDLYALYVAVEQYIGHTIQTRRGRPAEREAYAKEHGLSQAWLDDPDAVMRYPLESVTGIKADPKLVKANLAYLKKHGVVPPEITEAGTKAYKSHKKRAAGVSVERLMAPLREKRRYGQMEFGIRLANPLERSPFDHTLEEWSESSVWRNVGWSDHLEVALEVVCKDEPTAAERERIERAVRGIMDAVLAEFDEGQERFRGRGWGRHRHRRWTAPIVVEGGWKNHAEIILTIPEPQSAQDAARVLHGLSRLDESMGQLEEACGAKASARKPQAKKAAKKREPRRPKKKTKKKTKKRAKKTPEVDFLAAVARAEKNQP